ncbi:MAG: hypothetical protein RMJ54_18085 [Roseiflexaceae bacterium]|nr:hypothetical protein [Roseiflexaceae bacterium]
MRARGDPEILEPAVDRPALAMAEPQASPSAQMAVDRPALAMAEPVEAIANPTWQH